MTVAVARSTWQAHAVRLIDKISAQGDLRSPQWREALLAVPRHLFVPHYYLQDTSTRPARWIRHEPGDEEAIRGWLELVYSPTTLITDLAEYADRGVQMPVCSSTKPDLMIRMLEALDLRAGHRVLEIGTGTGYNAALLTHRLGDRNVCSVDIDPALIAVARERLAQLGYHPTLAARDGAEGMAEHAPFDRIIATCALRAFPASWMYQLRPGGRALVHLEGPLGAGNLLALRRDADQPGVQGRFLPWWGCFMARRTKAGSTTGSPRPVRTTEPPSIRITPLNPAHVDGTQMFPFLAQLHLPPDMYRAIYLTDDDTPVTYLASSDGSWCEITRTPDATGHYTVREAGPSPLWAGIETAWAQWTDLTAPAWHEFGLTATPMTHHIWYRDPDTGPCWTLPTPSE
ncbi:MAG TPA: methyltransferase domain-containing protein [Pseudonocardiaceae bacterium]|nr:methyltransferase domain-containing protein [Pseudonocardiaceae bacterium]